MPEPLPPPTWRRQLSRFVLAGALSACVDLGLLLLLRGAGLGYPPAKSLSFVAGTSTAYLLNRRWTFTAAPSGRRFAAVLVLYAVTFVVQVGLASACFDVLVERTDDLSASVLSFVLGQAVATTVNFLVQRHLIFPLR